MPCYALGFCRFSLMLVTFPAIGLEAFDDRLATQIDTMSVSFGDTCIKVLCARSKFCLREHSCNAYYDNVEMKVHVYSF